MQKMYVFQMNTVLKRTERLPEDCEQTMHCQYYRRRLTAEGLGTASLRRGAVINCLRANQYQAG